MPPAAGADAEKIGEQLKGYVAKGFDAVKMRIGVMDGTVDGSVARVRAARAALGTNIDIMVDAHAPIPRAKPNVFAVR